MADLKAWKVQVEAAAQPGSWKEALRALLKTTRDMHDRRGSADYAARARMALPILRTLAASDAAAARDACVLALHKLFGVCEQADDSDGFLGGVLQDVHDVLLEALQAAPPRGRDAARWLDTWMALEDEDPWGLWDDSAMLDAAGPEVDQAYAQRVAADWARWLQQRPATPAASRPSTISSPLADYDPVRARLRNRYLDDLHRRGDLPGLVEALRSDLSDAYEYVQLAEALEQLGRPREALQQLEEAERRQPGHPRVEAALLTAYEREGCTEEVLAIRRRQLERHPDAGHYQAVLAAAAAAGLDVPAYRDALHAWARQQEPERPGSGVRRSHGMPQRNVSVRLGWLLHEGLHDEALALAQAPDSLVPDERLLQLARAVRASHPEPAAAIFEEALKWLMGRAQSPYRQELELVREMLALMGPAQGRQMLAGLRTEYRAKRNFIAGLDSLAVA